MVVVNARPGQFYRMQRTGANFLMVHSFHEYPCRTENAFPVGFVQDRRHPAVGLRRDNVRKALRSLLGTQAGSCTIHTQHGCTTNTYTRCTG